jgi:hypothetical protein
MKEIRNEAIIDIYSLIMELQEVNDDPSNLSGIITFAELKNLVPLCYAK